MMANESRSRLREVLEEITRGEGAFNRDPLKHADNTVENMKALAREALTLLPSEKEPVSNLAGTATVVPHTNLAGTVNNAGLSTDKPSQSDTPRTDAQHAKWRIHDDPYTGMVNLARQLERELAAAQATLKELDVLGEQALKALPSLTPSHVAAVGEKMPRTFEFLLNAFEQASQARAPSDFGYAEKRRAVFQHVEDLWADYIRLLREKQDGLTPSAKAQRNGLADLVIRDVQELPDRTSPDDWPEAMLVTAAELRDIIERHA
jgi:hypothetical protein